VLNGERAKSLWRIAYSAWQREAMPAALDPVLAAAWEKK
jgi:hypothetical protein